MHSFIFGTVTLSFTTLADQSIASGGTITTAEATFPNSELTEYWQLDTSDFVLLTPRFAGDVSSVVAQPSGSANFGSRGSISGGPRALSITMTNHGAGALTAHHTGEFNIVVIKTETS